MQGFTKVTFNIPTDDLNALKAIAQKRKISVTSVLRRAIDLELYLDKKGGDEGAKLLIDVGGSLREIVRT